MLLPLFLLLSNSSQCPKYLCKPQSMTFSNNICSFPVKYDYYLNPCPQNFYCDFISDANSTCQAQKNTTQPGWPGEPCSEDLPCAHGSCFQGLCKGLPLDTPCNFTSNCDVGLHCWQGECKYLNEEGENCNQDFDCQSQLGCFVHYPHQSKCKILFSYNKDDTIYDCYNYYSKFCESATCEAPGGLDKGICIDPVQSKYVVTECDEKSDCLAMSGHWKFYQDCVCSLGTEGKSYCQPALGDFYGKHYLEYYKEWVLSDTIKECHSERRFEKVCMEKWKDYEEFMYWKLKHEFYPLIQDNNECTKQVVNTEYWEKVDDEEFSGFLVFGFGILFFN